MSQNCKKDRRQKTVLYQKQYTGTTSRQRMTYPLLQHQPIWSISTAYGWKESMEHRHRHNQQQAVFKPGDWVWVKTPHGRCTTKYKVGRVTRITSVQNVMVDGMPCHVKDLWPIVGPGQPTVCSDMVSEDASERFVTIRERPCEQAPSTNAGDASSDNTSNEDQVTLLSRRSTQHKRPPPECFMCDHRIRGSVVVIPRTILPRRNRRCALSATSMWKPEEEKDARGVTCFMEENEISLREVARFDEYKRD